MNRRKGISFSVFLLMLAPVMVFFYYLSGVYTVPGGSISSIPEVLPEILRHPFRNYTNGKTPIFLGCGFFLWLILSAYLMDRFRNFHAGREYGSQDWADLAAVAKRRTSKDDTENRIYSMNVRVGRGALPDDNALVIGPPGYYKSTSLIFTNILRANENMVILDVKSECLALAGNLLREKGVKIKVLNIADPFRSDQYNPFAYMRTEDDIESFVRNLKSSVEEEGTKKGEAIWEKGPMFYFRAIVEYVLWEAEVKHSTANIPRFLECIYYDRVQLPKGKGSDEKPTKFGMMIRELANDRKNNPKGEMHPAVRDYVKLRGAAQETMRSIQIIADTILSVFEYESVRHIFEKDTIALDELVYGAGGTPGRPTEKKSALFIIVPPGDKKYNFIASMVYRQFIDMAQRAAHYELRARYGGKLPIPFTMYLDEYFAGARPDNIVEAAGTLRSIGGSIMVLLQTKHQLDIIHEEKGAKALAGLFPVIVYLGSAPGDEEMHKWIGAMVGQMTADMQTDGRSGTNGSLNNSRVGMPLVETAEIPHIDCDFKDCIIFMAGEYPIYDRKALPWEMPEKLVPFRHATELNEKYGEYVHPVMTKKDPRGKYVSVNLDEEEQPVLPENRQEAENMEVIDMGADGFIYARLNDLVKENSVSAAFVRAFKEETGPVRDS